MVKETPAKDPNGQTGDSTANGRMVTAELPRQSREKGDAKGGGHDVGGATGLAVAGGASTSLGARPRLPAYTASAGQGWLAVRK